MGDGEKERGVKKIVLFGGNFRHGKWRWRWRLVVGGIEGNISEIQRERERRGGMEGKGEEGDWRGWIWLLAPVGN